MADFCGKGCGQVNDQAIPVIKNFERHFSAISMTLLGGIE